MSKNADLKELWMNVLTRLEPTIKRTNFITWFRNTAAFEIKDSVLVIGVPNVFAQDWILGKYKVKILQAAQEFAPQLTGLEVEVKSELLDSETPLNNIDVSKINSSPEKKVRKVRGKQEVSLGNGVRSKMLNERYNLDSFITGKENRLPHAAATAVANMPGGIYNPMYIYGGVGLGKTHLLQSVGNAILKDTPEKIVRYLTAERFVSEVVDSMRNGKMDKFKTHYRDIDVLLVDDVQFFAKKNSSQQEFFHTFNELYDANKQIVITSDRPPSELDDLENRLTTRFGIGMVVEVLMPEFETRIAILQDKCMDWQMIIDPDVLEFIAANVSSSVRELESVLRQVIGEAKIDNRVPTVKSAAEVFQRLYRAKEIIGLDVDKGRDENFVMTAGDVMKVVSSYYRVTVDELKGEVRKKEVMVPRQVCMYMIRHELSESFEKIGQDFGGRMHTTVMNACNNVIKKLKKDSRLVRDINAIKREMGL
ncbi:chromosomal replication initiator protein DnaA [Candidatus Peregrinibacteria bacterium]|jgi:chromosomal replication initiator protein|nr:chromosomal replication initiator protein DnaA [Candidatus Peregrinibacteria bacterium]MBT4148515.1 chromosomal replication initiator protein DnaA [Candidatus Peregrinibacteria bacterium]MBT4366704.1 chromosomal replication initiator protein DnaA [Candidatus Peregrinibacteria bacterium]MBT4455527.1 chromosomal replication initiator protein DnaA [Candidatus Peregrinibacteria bacterium]